MSQLWLKSQKLGQYYTPEWIVDYIIDQTLGQALKNQSENHCTPLTVLDPACGKGIFLVKALNVLFSYNKSPNETSGNLENVRKKIIAYQLYGIDIDDEAIIATQTNLSCLSFDTNFKALDALVPPLNYDYNYDVSRLMELRGEYKELFINEDNHSTHQEKQLELLMIENQILKIMQTEIEKEFQISSSNRIMPWETIFPETNGKFDIIVGNPPWGVPFSSDFLRFYDVGTQQADSWSLFLEKSLKALKEGGRLGFVVPNTLLTNENYISVRKLILETCQIHSIINLGERIFHKVTQPCMIIILVKKVNSSDHQINIIRHISPEMKDFLEKRHGTFSSLPSITCSQDRFINNPDYQFDIYSIGFEELKEIIEKDLYQTQFQVKPLKDLVENARGVELNKNGKVVKCPSCGLWSSPPSNTDENGVKVKLCENPECPKEITEHDETDFIVCDTPQPPGQDQPFLAGYQIQRYYLCNHRYIDPTRKGINYKDPALYQGPKLLLRKTGRGIKTAIDYANRWVNQVVYLFKLNKNVPVTLEYIMGVLNSKLMNKYYYMEYADPYRKDFPHFTQKRFLQLPIKVPVTSDEMTLVSQIGKKAKVLQSQYQEKYSIIQCFSDENVNIEHLDLMIKQLEKDIDNLVFELYKLTSYQNSLVFTDFFASG